MIPEIHEREVIAIINDSDPEAIPEKVQIVTFINNTEKTFLSIYDNGGSEVIFYYEDLDAVVSALLDAKRKWEAGK